MIVRAATRRVAIIGNPNTGKTSVFNALTGLSQRVGNYPGVTVEKKTGAMTRDISLIDLPGTYSLAAHSPDELVAVRVLLGEQQDEPRPDLVVVIADASSLRRSLYLVTQVMEVGLPAIVALNMMDVARRGGVEIDHEALSRELGVPIIPTIANRRETTTALRRAIEEHLDSPTSQPAWEWAESITQEVSKLSGQFEEEPFFLTRALIDEGGAAETDLISRSSGEAAAALTEARSRIREGGSSPAALEARMRYTWIQNATAACVKTHDVGPSVTDRLDAVLTHRVIGSLVFVIVMGAAFITVFQWAGPFMDMISGFFDTLGVWITHALAGTPLAGGALESLLVDGVVAGVGAVLVFLPQIVLLFLFIAVLEDCGYMARTAFLMDRLLRFSGLSGHSFIPMLSSFACAVPGVMAARVIRNPRDRLATIVVAPLLSCSARIPVYTIMIAAFIPASMVAGFLPLQGLVFVAMYLIGVLVAALVAFILKRTLLKGPTPTFIMEMPSYKLPSSRTVLMRVFERARAFVVQAGTIIFVMSIVVWALGYFPRSSAVSEDAAAEREVAEATLAGDERDERLDEIDRSMAGVHLRQSFLGRMGRAVEPIVRPLGWDWKIGMAVIASFPAREVIVSTLGVIYDLGDEGSEDQQLLTEKLRGARWPNGERVFSFPVGVSIMIFFALCCQCAATLATIRRETNSWRWPIFTFSYMTGLAYLGALVAHQLLRAALS